MPQRLTKFVRFSTGIGSSYGIWHNDGIQAIAGTPFMDWRPTDQWMQPDDVELLVPCHPSKILAVGRNFKSHLHGRPEPTVPEFFFKPPSALQHPDKPISLPLDATDVHFEGEMVLVIGQRCRNVSEWVALDYLLGITIGNDLSDRNWQRGEQKDLQWWRAKGCDTFAPCGPCIVAGLEPNNLLLETRVNGELQQSESTTDLIFSAARCVAFASRYLTLEPGDLIYTGTPGNTKSLKHGDVVEVFLEEVGVLRNPVRLDGSEQDKI
jgi:2-keto-4-pentenoate hydratase/2-oxohepta-3-ene-1,7-dioic acid hydratase in catechol pathway